MKRTARVHALCGILLAGTITLSAATITVDENGHGDVDGVALSFMVGQDPMSGGASNALIYNLPSTVVPGAVDLLGGPIPEDILRFEGNTLVFYSAGPPIDSLADHATPPTPVPNTIQITETGAPGNDGAFYTPTAGQPGFNASTPTTYHFISDVTATVVPEPSALGMGVSGVLLLSIGAIRRRTNMHRRRRQDS